jgi:beta-lactamase regulating signal transducer with metallopeptidase domain/thiol-disulfide isomerase/thioredoxin
MSGNFASWVETLNHAGRQYWDFAGAMLLQVGVLAAVLAILDAIWLRHTRAAVRYGVWCLILVKLLLPVSLAGPLAWSGALDWIPQGRVEQDSRRGRSPDSAAHEIARPAQPALPIAADIPHEVVAFRPADFPLAEADNQRTGGGATPALVPPTASPIRPAISWQAWLLLAWIAGVAALATLVAARWWQVRQLVQQASAASPRLASLLAECQQQLGIPSAQVRLLVTDQLDSPAICGLLRASILFPRDLASRLSDEQIRLVLCHELLHWKRFDLQLGHLQTTLQVVYFYNPVVWLVTNRLRRLREQAVDEAVLATSPTSAECYSTTLLDIVSLARPQTNVALQLVGVVESRRALAERIHRIVSRPIPRRAGLGLSGLAVLLLLGAICLPLSGRGLAAIEPPEPATQPTQSAAEPAAAAQPAAGTPAKNQAATTKSAPEVDAPRADELAGTVVDEAGQPLAGVTVDAWHWAPGNETKTDEQGRFRLTELQDDGARRKIELLITKPGYTPVHIAQQPTGVKDWVVTLGNRTYLAGTVTGIDGKPAAGITLRAKFGPVQGDGVMISDVPFEGKSGEDGSYRLFVPQGTYDLQVAGGAAGTFRQSEIVVKPHEEHRLDVQLEKGLRLEARVVDSITGEPVEGFVLWQWRGDKLFGRSDAEGNIVFEGLVAGEIEFQCGGGKEIDYRGLKIYQHGPFGRWWSPQAKHEWQRFQIDEPNTAWQRNFDDLVLDLQPTTGPIVIVAEQGTRVSGRVTDPDGKPVEGATVAPARTGSGNSLTGDTRYSVRTDKKGKYEVVLPASNGATYNLVVHDGDYREWRKWANGVAEPMQTKPGQVIADFDLQLTKPAIIRGKVTLGGRPLAGREVRTHAFDKRENRYYDPTTRTDKDGAFELKFVRPGRHYLQVEPFWLSAEDAPGGSKIVEVKAGETLEVELTGAPTQDEWRPVLATLPFSAHVVDAEGKPVSGVAVGLGLLGGVTLTGGKQSAPGENGQVVRTDAEGKAPLAASLMAQIRQSTTLVYAVDAAGKRAGVGTLNMLDHADKSPVDPPEPIRVVLAPAVATKFTFDTSAFDKLPDGPAELYLGIAKDGLPLQHGVIAKQDAAEFWLPPGSYRVSVSGGLSEAVQAEFTLKEGETDREVKLTLLPTHFAKLLGQPAPVFEQVRSLGDAAPDPLASYRGKIVVLDFWGTWCGPCIAAMPNLMKLHDEFAAKGVEFIALHDDSVDSPAALREQLDRLAREKWEGRSIPFTVLLDGGGTTAIPGSKLSARGATTAAYGITAFPTTVLIDRDGKIAATIAPHDLEASRARIQMLVK